MQNKVSVNTNIGMLRDRSISKTDNQFAFENHNIRITARDKDTLLSVTNERGNRQVVFSNSDDAKSSKYNGVFANEILGTLLGYAVLNKYLVLFTTDNGTDYIYRIQYFDTNDEWYLRLLYQGSLKFDDEHPIETISLFETEDVQKVYWLDGKNQPRVINIKKNYFRLEGSRPIYSKNTIFDFVTDYNHSGDKEVTVSVEKQQLGMGSFPAGTIQYVCTYFNQYGQETNPVYISPIYYVSPEDRGGDAETTYTCSFKITLSNVDTEFDYARVYAILRTSESGTPTAYVVGTIKISTEALSIVDSGQGDNVVIDPTILLYIGGREITAGTFSHKDNTLFLGDLKFTGSKNDASIGAIIADSNIYNTETYKSNIVEFFYSTSTDLNAPYYGNNGLYPYECQLNSSSDKITSFKGGEKYRFAIQFITSTGQRSRAFFIGDAENPYYPSIDTNSNTIRRPLPRVLLPDDVARTAYNAGYIQAVLLMAEASEGDRSVVAQGIISPTVFNLGQRSSNAPFAISSWYMRPRNSMINSRHLESVNNVTGVSKENGKIVKANMSFCEIQNIEPEVSAYYNEDSFKTQLVAIAFRFISECVDPGRVSVGNLTGRMRYNHALYAAYKFSDGSSSTWRIKNNPESAVATGFNESNIETIVNDRFKVGSKSSNDGFSHRTDRVSVVQGWFRSAEIPEDYWPDPDTEIVHQRKNEVIRTGGVFTVGISDSSSQAYYSRLNSEQFFIDENIITLNTPDIDKLQSTSWSGLKFRIVGIAEVTSNITDYTVQTTTGLSTSAGIYRIDLNHTDSQNIEGLMSYPLLYDSSIEYDTENEKYKEDSNSRTYPRYFNIFPFHKEGSITHNEKITTKYSEIEKKVFSNLRYCYNTKFLWTGNGAWRPSSSIAMTTTSGSQSNQFKQINSEGKNYIYQGTYDYMSTTGNKPFGIYAYDGDNGLEEQVVKGSASDYVIGSTEPVRIQFQSLPHVVIKFGKTQGKNELLPLLNDEYPFSKPDDMYLPWEDAAETYQAKLEYSTSLPYYFIGELYKDMSVSDDRYGGNTQAALENNTFIPISSRYDISNGSVLLIGTQGDTYFQRWDCLKTEPYSDESKNGIVDITSFMVETHTNIEGRYDARRGLLKNVTTSRENSNLINRVYSNTNNFFTSSVLSDKYYLSDFPNQITWTKTKTLAEDIDTWTNVTVANTLDLDGDKGSVRAIRRFNNSLIAFQDRGISEILFNSRTQLSTTSGVPIEIGNSGKVEGKRYISEKSGCVNKWSITEAKTGIYFIDNINKNISVIGQGIQDVSGSKGFSSWVRSYNTLDIWNPKDRNNFVSFYDTVHNDIYFVTKHEDIYNDDSCLVFNETLGQFTSFFDYEDVPMMVNVGDRFLSFKDTKLWLQNEGNYNEIFGKKYPYWIKYRICPDPYGDKTFNNIEYRADIITPNDDSDVVEQSDFLTDKTFDNLKIWNEYQNGTLDLTYDNVRVSDLKKKFRIWRANIPRDSKDIRGLNRIRNPWVYLQLSKYKELDNERMEFHDLLVKYYE